MIAALIRARPIAAGAGAGALIALLLALLAWPLVDRLADARRTSSAAQAILDRPATPPAPLVAAGQAVAARDAAEAARQLDSRIVTLARGNGLLPESVAPHAAPGPGLLAVQIRVSGGEKAVLALIDTLEREPPLARFGEARIEAISGDAVRLEAVLVAAWQ